MAKRIAESMSVAYFDRPDHVSEPGFYVVEKEASDNDGEIAIGDRVYPAADGHGFTAEAEVPADEEADE